MCNLYRERKRNSKPRGARIGKNQLVSKNSKDEIKGKKTEASIEVSKISQFKFCGFFSPAGTFAGMR
jgi:hypothetical protein